MEFIPTRVNAALAPAIEQLIARIKKQADEVGLDGAVMYYGWPKYTDYEAVRHQVDLAIIGPKVGLILGRVLIN